MARCDVAVGGRWPSFSAAAVRRRILQAVFCGLSNRQLKTGGNSGSFPPVAPEVRRSERLAELLLLEAQESRNREEEEEKRRKIQAFDELQNVVKALRETGEGCELRRRQAAADVRRIAKESSDARRSLAMLGAIPPLVGMLDGEDADTQIAALYALLNLGIGNDANKSAVVKAGGVHKMLALIRRGTPAAAPAIVAVFLSLSALDDNKPIIGASSDAINFLTKTFRNPNPNFPQWKDDALRALFNLSLFPGNAGRLIDSGIVPSLLAAVGDDIKVCDRALSILSNLVAASPESRQALRNSADAFPILVDVLKWNDEAGCQEKAAYILMVMAHKSHCADRASMVAAGITSALLELALVGSALAQKRASRILEIFSEGKGKSESKGMLAVSAPIARSEALSTAGGRMEDEEEGMSEERKAVRRMVEQSWRNNMRRITRRANLPTEFALSDHFRELAASSTSKSLPF